MAFGVTPTGFVSKRLADIKSEIEATLRGTFGSGVNLDARGPFGQLIGIFAEREAEIWELAELVYNSQFPVTADGVGVDNALSLVGLTRKNPTPSIAVLRLFGDGGTLVPAGSQVSKFDDPNVIFETLASVTIPLLSGTNEEQTINFSAVPDSGSWQIDFDGQQTGVLAFNIAAALLQTELENLSNVGAGNVLVTGNFASGFLIEFQGALAELDQPQLTIVSNALLNGVNPVTATPTTTVQGLRPNVTVNAQCTVTGPVAAPASSLTVIDTPISGWDTVLNELDAELGTNLETDAEAKQRREESLAFPGHSTIPAIVADLLQIDGVEAVRGFENTTFIVDTRGRPPKSFEMVVLGGDDVEVAQAILDAKPAGIETYGDEVENLLDSQGFSKEVRFSRPDAIPIYIVLDLQVNSAYPPNGDDLVKEALVAFGNDLTIGEDIIVVPKLLCALDNIPGIEDIGITDAIVRIGTAPLPTPGTQAVTFANVATDLAVDYVAHPLSNTDRIFFTTTGTLPTGLSPNTTYWVRDVTANQFKLSDERTGALIDFVDAGTGTHTVHFGGLEDNIAIEDTEIADFDTSRITVNS